jgi:NADH-quinone oxidoreductase subunit E
LNELLSKYPEEIGKILAKYPEDYKRSAVMPLLHLAQREETYVSPQALQDIADICQISVTDVTALIGFYTLYYDKPSGRYHIQVCTDLPCALRGAEEFLDKLCQSLGVKVGEPSEDGAFVVEEVKCIAACHRAPVFQVQGDGEISYHEDQTVGTALAIIEGLRQKAAQRKKAQL